MNKGVLYVGIDEEYYNQAIKSLESIKKHTDIQSAIITSEEVVEPDETPFDEIIYSDNPHHDVRDKSTHLGLTPFDQTLYLDGDTLVIGDISPVFPILDRVDIAAAHSTHKELVTIDQIPETFPEFNTGVIAYNKNDRVLEFFQEWQNIHNRQIEQGRPDEEIPVEQGDSLEEIKYFGKKTDQPPFREALFKSDVSYSVLPEEYNFGAWGRSFAYGTVKIIHGRSYRQSLLKNSINQSLGQRIYLEGKIGNIYHKNGGIQRVYPIQIRVLNFIMRNFPIIPFVEKLRLSGVASQIYELYRRKFMPNE